MSQMQQELRLLTKQSPSWQISLTQVTLQLSQEEARTSLMLVLTMAQISPEPLMQTEISRLH